MKKLPKETHMPNLTEQRSKEERKTINTIQQYRKRVQNYPNYS